MTIFRGPDGKSYTIYEFPSLSWRRWWGKKRYEVSSYNRKGDNDLSGEYDSIDHLDFKPISYV